MYAIRRVKRTLLGKRALFIPMIRAITPLLDYFYPKDDKTIIFGSDSTWSISGDPKAMFEYMRSHYPKYKVFFFTQKPTERGHVNPKSIESLFIFLRARYGVSSNGMADFGEFRWSRKKIVLATWHAISMKTVGYTERGRTSLHKQNIEKYTKSTAGAIASSRHDAAISCLMFGFGGRIFLTGHPRNDRLLREQSFGKKTLKQIIPHLNGKERIILYAPTFRGGGTTGQVMKTRFFPFPDFSSQQLSKFLDEQNMVLLIRKHSADTISGVDFEDKRIVNFNHDKCPDVNNILPDVDYLITDYSSIGYDFLLLDRPMMFIPYDLEDYQKYRGLIIDNYNFWTPGPKLSSFKEFLDYIQQCQQDNDPFREARHELNKVINSYQTENSIPRVLHALNALKRER